MRSSQSFGVPHMGLNRLSDYVLRHMLSFIDDDDLSKSASLDKKFNNMIKSDGRHKINCFLSTITNSECQETIKKYGNILDIVERKNPQQNVFFIIDFSHGTGITIDSMCNTIRLNSALFIDLGLNFGWKLNDVGQWIIRVSDILTVPFHKYLVEPCRAYNLLGVRIRALRLRTYSCLMKRIDNDDNHVEYSENRFPGCMNLYKQLIQHHPELIKENSIYMINRVMDRLSWFHENNGVSSLMCLPNETGTADNRRIEMTKRRMGLLIESGI